MNREKLFLVCLAFLIAACSSGGDSSTDIEFARTDNTVIIRLGANPDRLNPALSSSSFARPIFEQIHLYLVSFDPVEQRFVPELVEEVPEGRKISEGDYAGGAAYDFRILDAATWDDGSPITGADYAFTLKAALNPLVKSPQYRPYLANIRNVEIDPDDPKSFTVYTKEDQFDDPEFITNTLPVLPAYVYDPKGLLNDIPFTAFSDLENIAALADSDERLKQFADTFNSQPYSREPEFVKGAGPYELVEWITDELVRLRKKEDWWAEEIDTDKYTTLKAFPQELVFKPISNQATATAALRAEEIDAMFRIDNLDFEEMKENEYTSSRFSLEAPLAKAVYFISVNATDPLLREQKVRQAISHVVNVAQIVNDIYLGYGERAVGPVFPTQEWYNDDLQPVAFDIERAKTLLAEAGWEDTDDNGIVDKVIDGERRDLSITYSHSNSTEQSANSARLIKEAAQQAGIDIQLQATEPRTMLMNWARMDYQLNSVGRTIPSTWNPRQSYHSEGDNRTGCTSPETDALIDRITSARDEAERNRLYKELQSMLYEQRCEIFMFHPQNTIAIHKRFETETFAPYPGFQPRYFKLRKELQ